MKRKRADQILPGDFVDFEGDPFADPGRDHLSFQYQYAEVVFVEMETPECVAIGIDGFDIAGFPPAHLLDVMESENA